MDFVFVDILIAFFIGSVFITLGKGYVFVTGCVILALGIILCILVRVDVCVDDVEKTKVMDVDFKEI